MNKVFKRRAEYAKMPEKKLAVLIHDGLGKAETAVDNVLEMFMDRELKGRLRKAQRSLQSLAEDLSDLTEMFE